MNAHILLASSLSPVSGTVFTNGLVVAVVALLHIQIAAYLTGSSTLATVSEAISMARGDERQGRVAHMMVKSQVYIFGFGSATAIFFLVFVLVGLWAIFWTALQQITFWVLVFEAAMFLTEIVLLYTLYANWDRLGAHRRARLAMMVLLNISLWWQMFLIDVVASFMLTPNGGDVSLLNQVLNPTALPLTIHRTIGNIAWAGAVTAFVGAFNYLRLTRHNRVPTPDAPQSMQPLRSIGAMAAGHLDWEERRKEVLHWEWVTQWGVIWAVALTLLQPWVGYSYAKEVQLHAYGAWYTMMFGDLSNVFLMQIFLLGTIFSLGCAVLLAEDAALRRPARAPPAAPCHRFDSRDTLRCSACLVCTDVQRRHQRSGQPGVVGRRPAQPDRQLHPLQGLGADRHGAVRAVVGHQLPLGVVARPHQAGWQRPWGAAHRARHRCRGQHDDDRDGCDPRTFAPAVPRQRRDHAAPAGHQPRAVQADTDARTVRIPVGAVAMRIPIFDSAHEELRSAIEPPWPQWMRDLYALEEAQDEGIDADADETTVPAALGALVAAASAPRADRLDRGWVAAAGMVARHRRRLAGGEPRGQSPPRARDARGRRAGRTAVRGCRPRRIGLAEALPRAGRHRMSASVLIVEDEPMIGRILAEKLTREGYTVSRASTIAALRAAVASVDVALVDSTLDGDGIDAMRVLAVASVRPRAGWFALIESRDAADGDRAVLASAAGVIIKPFKPTAVAAKVATLLAAAVR